MEKSKVVEKVKKLLKLAEGDNIHEATLASVKAQKLIEEYKIEKFELENEYKFNVESFIIKHDMEKPPLWLLDLHKGLSDFLLGAALIHTEMKLFIFVGEEEDFAIYEYLYNYISREVKKETYKFQQQRTGRKKEEIDRDIDSYALGLVSNLIDRLKATRESYEHDIPEKTGYELVQVRKDEIQKFLDKAKPRKVQPDVSGLSIEEFNKGVENGEKIPLQKVLTNKDKC